MDKTKPTFSINMIANPGTSRTGAARPNFRGTVAAPDQEQRHFDIALWAGTFNDPKTGEDLVVLNGHVTSFSRDDDAMSQMRDAASATGGPAIEINNIKLEAGKIVLFQAKHENGNIADNGKRRSDFYGYWNNNGKRVDIGGWANKGKDGRVSVVGRSQVPMSQEHGAAIEPVSDLEIAGMEQQAAAEQEQTDTRKRAGRGR